MGQVFKARQSSLHRLVALKVVRPECLANQRVIRRFLREIEAASQLVHPNVVRAYDADQIGGAYYIAMEYIEGIDLAHLVKQAGPLPVWLACDLVRQAALGLQHAFEHGLIHRDIKPANLLVSGISIPKKRAGQNGNGAAEPVITTPVLKITDFGLARWTDDDPDRPIAHLTQVGSVLGTPEFMSPEQTRNSSTCDIRADLYSLGCTFYCLLAGQVPFSGGTLTDKLLAHQLDTAEPVAKVRRARLAAGLEGQEWSRAIEDRAQVPAAIEQIVVKLLAKQPQQRFQTPAELAEHLANVQERLGRGALPVPPKPQPAALVEFDLMPRPASVRPIVDAVMVANTPPPKHPAGAPLREAALTPDNRPGLPLPTIPHRRLWPWALAGGAALVTLAALVAGLSVLVFWSFGNKPGAADPDRADVADDTPWHKLLLKEKRLAPAAFRHDLLIFRTQFPGSTHGRAIDEWLTRLPSAFDKLDRVMVPKVPLVTAKSPIEMVGVLGKHQGYFNKPASIVAVSPDGRWLLGAAEPDVRLWDTADLAKPPARLHPHGKRVYAATFSPDGKWLATAGDEPIVRFWDPVTRAPGPTFEKHRAAVTRLAFARDGELLASAGADGKILLSDPTSGAERGSLPIGSGDVQSLAFSRDGAALFWGTATHVRWAQIERGTFAGKPSEFAMPGAVRVLTFAPDGQTLLCGGGQGALLACSWNGRQLVRRARLDHDVTINKKKVALPVNQAVFTPDGLTIATVCSDHRVRIWDSATLSLQKTWDLQCPVVAAVFALDGRHLITGNGNSTLTIFRLATCTAAAAK